MYFFISCSPFFVFPGQVSTSYLMGGSFGFSKPCGFTIKHRLSTINKFHIVNFTKPLILLDFFVFIFTAIMQFVNFNKIHRCFFTVLTSPGFPVRIDFCRLKHYIS